MGEELLPLYTMTNFSATLDGTFRTKPKGKIQFRFKGMNMHTDIATVVLSSEKILTVSRDSDARLFDFIDENFHWCLKGCTSTKNPLYGTEFIFNE